MFGKKKNEQDEKYLKLGKIVILMKEGKYEEALKIHESIFDKKSSADWYTKGNLNQRLGKPHDALICYNEAVELDPNHVKAWYRSGTILLSTGRFFEAINCFEHIIIIEQQNKFLTGEKWSYAAMFSCMIACIYQYNKIVKEHFDNKTPYSKENEEFSNKTNGFEESCHGMLIENKIITRFANENEFVDFCIQNYNNILDKLEPNVEGLFLRGKTSQWNIQYGKVEDLEKKGFKTNP